MVYFYIYMGTGAERRPSTRLTAAEKTRLNKGITSLRKEGDNTSRGLPPISDDLREQLLRFLNLDGDANTRWEEAQRKGEVFYHPVLLADQMVKDEFGTLMASCEPQTIPIRDWINREFKVSLHSVNSAAIGEGLVIKAYHLMFGADFIKGFGQIGTRDVTGALEAETRLPEERFSLMSIATRTYHMPAHQYNLEFCLSELAMAAPVYQAVLDGGTAIFRMLDRNADKIIPPVIS